MSTDAEDRPGVFVHGRPSRRGALRRLDRDVSPRAGKHAEKGHELGVTGGLAALSLDALSSVAYGPEAMMLVLVTAGVSALRYMVPLTIVITAMLALLVVSYTQVIAAYPEGGGAYSVSKANLGRTLSLLAAASVVVDYVLTVAVSLAAGAASLGSVFPSLSHHLLAITLVGLLILTAVNMFGIAESAKLLALPTAIFVVSILATIVVGALRPHPVAVIGTQDARRRDRDGRDPVAVEGVRVRMLRGHRRGGDLQRCAGVSRTRGSGPRSGPRSRSASCSP